MAPISLSSIGVIALQGVPLLFCGPFLWPSFLFFLFSAILPWYFINFSSIKYFLRGNVSFDLALNFYQSRARYLQTFRSSWNLFVILFHRQLFFLANVLHIVLIKNRKFCVVVSHFLVLGLCHRRRRASYWDRHGEARWKKTRRANDRGGDTFAITCRIHNRYDDVEAEQTNQTTV